MRSLKKKLLSGMLCAAVCSASASAISPLPILSSIGGLGLIGLGVGLATSGGYKSKAKLKIVNDNNQHDAMNTDVNNNTQYVEKGVNIINAVSNVLQGINWDRDFDKPFEQLRKDYFQGVGNAFKRKKENFASVVEAFKYKDEKAQDIRELDPEEAWTFVNQCLVHYDGQKNEKIKINDAVKFGVKYDASLAKNGTMIYYILRDKGDGSFIFRCEMPFYAKAVRVRFK